MFQKLLFIVNDRILHDSHVPTAEEIHADVAGVALQGVHAHRIKLPVLSSADKVGVA